MKKFFIAGTDTEVGKTYSTELLLKLFNQEGKKTLGIKPIASGAQMIDGKLRNEDATILLNASSATSITYDQVNPFVFTQPIAPHIASKMQGIELTVNNVHQKIDETLNSIDADIALIEGVGGWSVPLNEKELMSDLVALLNIPVILVVGVKLGCLNHAIITAETILRSNIPFAGWIANCLEPKTQAISENIQTLLNWIKAPFIGKIPYNSQQESLDLSVLCKEISPAEHVTS